MANTHDNGVRLFGIPSWVLVVIGVIETTLVVWWTPWNLVSPVDHSLVVATVHAPLWSRPTSPTAHFEVDARLLIVWLIAIWASIGLLFLLTDERR